MFGKYEDGIAVIGMAARFPGARNVAEFWENLRVGAMSLTRLTDDGLRRAGVPQEALADPDYIKVAALLDDIDRFEPALFGISPREAEAMDPQMRILLEVCHDALEDAGHDPFRFRGRIGMYAGAGRNEYLAQYVRANPQFMEAIGEPRARITNYADFLSTSVSYHLGLRGPSVTSVTACSTSLVTVHMACTALLNDECDIAVAGGVEIPLPAYRGYQYSQGGGILATDGVVRPYDARASGTVFGAGAGVVVIKRLREAITDRDAIHAVIIGSAINNDGAVKSGYAAPSESGQAEVLASALRNANVDPASVGFVEGHGTGTPVSDSIEVAALNQVYGAGRSRRSLALGSVKGNVGHLGAASGICGLIKAVHSVREGIIPASLNFSAPNPRLDLDSGPFYVADRTAPWPQDPRPRRAAVNSFGVGGTNAHLILQQPPTAQTGTTRPYQLLTFSARTPTALAALEETFRSHLSESDPNPTGAQELADVAYTLAQGRRVRTVRHTVIASDHADAVQQLSAGPADTAHSAAPSRTPGVIFLMPEQSAQYASMARQLYEREPEFAAVLDHCGAVLRRSHSLDLTSVLLPATDEAAARADAMIDRTSVSQPALFAVEYALARLLISWGVEPVAMVGHGTGEYVAAALAGVMDADDALRLVADRGLLIESLPPGAMMAVALSEDQLRPILPPGVDLAAVNASAMCVASGPEAAVRELEVSLFARNAKTRRLRTTHALHSWMMTPVLGALQDRFATIRLQAPRIPFVSTVTGDWITTEQATSPTYWARQVRARVRFADAIELLLKDGDYCFAEVGPGNALSNLVSETAAGPAAEQSSSTLAVPMLRSACDDRDDLQVLLQGVGRLWSHGCSVDWHRFWMHEKRGLVHLPTYPYERESFWVKPVTSKREGLGASPNEGPCYLPTWTETSPPSASTVDVGSVWVIFAHPNEPVTDELSRLLVAGSGNVVVVAAGSTYAEGAGGNHTVRPREAADYAKLAAAVFRAGPKRVRLVHAWLLGGALLRTEQATVRRHLDLGLYSLLLTFQEFSRKAAGTPLDVSVLTSSMQDVLGDGDIHPAKAAVRGLIKTVTREMHNVTIRGIDVGAGRAETVATQLFRELRSGTTEQEVALRGRKRWVARHSVIRLTETAGRSPVLKEEGVYVITGGLGRLGLVLARELAKRTRARIVLVGRSGLPGRSEWTSLSAHSRQDDAVRERIRAVLAMEEAGGQVLVCSGDVTDEARMREIRAAVTRAYGQVDGVFHLAGIVGGGLVEAHAQEDVGRVLAPKVLGAYVLDRVFRPPLLVLYSSTTAITGGYGHFDDAAANACLDAYAQAQWGAGRHVVSINWPQRADVDVPAEEVRPGVHRDGAISPMEAAEVLLSILGSGIGPEVVVSPGGLLWRERPAGRVAVGVGGADGRVPELGLAARYVETQYTPPRNDVERTMTALWQQALGMEQVGLDDDFQELGMNSIAAVGLAARISEQYGVAVSVGELFDGRTPRAAAEGVQAALKHRLQSSARIAPAAQR